MIPSEVYALGASGNPIREIADYAMRRAEEVGAENVYDFSIGSPSIAPPAAAQEAAERLMKEMPPTQLHAYSPDQGLPEVRKAVADYLNSAFSMTYAPEDIYMTSGASAGLAYNQKVGAESAVDINLAKQLNVLLTQLGVPAGSICMNLGSSAAGYGYEYLSSTLDRVKAAALQQNDAMLQMPIVTPVSPETWGTKEAVLPEAEAPEWGPAEERGIEMEICTASACLVGGSNVVIMKHPASIATIAKFIDSLM